METRERIVTYWLCPAEPARSRFAKLIGELAARFDAPAFEPHVTLYVTDAAREKPDQVLVKVLPERKPFRLTVVGLDYSNKFTQTLFVRFEPDAELSRLSEDLRRASATQSDYELNPHLSLLYKTMSEETKRELASSIRLDIAEVRFDSVKAVISPANIQDRSDVEAWRVVTEEKLAE